MENNTTENKVNFIMGTDWLFQEPIDFEHKKYVLLAYFKKIDELLNQNKLYPTFIELSLHLASLQTLIKENVILFTNKNFNSLDDEVLLKELSAKNVPTLTLQDIDEIDKIIKFSATKFFEYFSIFKSYWTVVYDDISINLKRNKKYLNSANGYMIYQDKENDITYVWEYNIDRVGVSIDDYHTNVNLIYQGDRKKYTLNQIIDNFSSFSDKHKKVSPVFELKGHGGYPLEETLLPLFKRKVLTYIMQSVRSEDIKNF